MVNKVPNVHFGRLLDVFGRTVDSNGMRIVPAQVKLEGSMFSFEYPLADHMPTFPPILRTPLSRGYEAAWIRARIPYLFGFTPEPSEAEKSLLNLGFIAVTPNLEDAFPFNCTDYYGKTALVFSPNGPPVEMKARIASAYWEALLADPEQLCDFATSVRHLGAPIVLEFGCQDGEPYCEERQDEAAEDV